MTRFLPLLVIGLLLIAAAGCGTPQATPVLPPVASAVAVDTQPPSVPTVAQLASLGEGDFAASCARCHGGQGQGMSGPALIGSGFNAKRYGDAQALLGTLRTMPLGAPSSLSDATYLQILSWPLLQNKLIGADQPLDVAQLAAISLTK